MKNKTIAVIALALAVACLFAEPARKRVGVVSFSPIEISRSDAETITGLFASELVSAGVFDVIDRTNIQKILKEVEFQQSGLTDSSKAVKVGKILALEYMVTGTISRLGSVIVANVQLTNVETSQIEKTSIQRFAAIESSLDTLKAAAYEISGRPAPATAETKEEQNGGVTAARPAASAGGMKTPGRAGYFYIEPSIGTLFVSSTYYKGRTYSHGFETGINARYMFNEHFGAAVGPLFAISSSVTVGACGYLLLYMNDFLGIGIGFQGSPYYLDYFGGPAAYLTFWNVTFRAATNILGSAPTTTSLGVLYAFKL